MVVVTGVVVVVDPDAAVVVVVGPIVVVVSAGAVVVVVLVGVVDPAGMVDVVVTFGGEVVVSDTAFAEFAAVVQAEANNAPASTRRKSLLISSLPSSTGRTLSVRHSVEGASAVAVPAVPSAIAGRDRNRHPGQQHYKNHVVRRCVGEPAKQVDLAETQSKLVNWGRPELSGQIVVSSVVHRPLSRGSRSALQSLFTSNSDGGQTLYGPTPICWLGGSVFSTSR